MFDKFFNGSNPFWNITGNLFDLFILNVLWLICSLPLVTIGPATTAFYYACIQMVLQDDTGPSKLFFRSFRLNLKQGMLLGIPFTLILVFLIRDMKLCYQAGRG
ncbi:MAG: YesL family protein, partial [Lachnospiraceae bacterium]|nr:YesL family protein [Lachnospiraceae bacterium]